MNFEYYISKRIITKNKANFSRPIVKLSIVGIALGLASMIISVSILTGFQTKIRDKVIGFGSHIQISNFDSNSSFESVPIDKNQSFYPYLDTVKGIKHIQVYAVKAGIIKTKDQIQGVVLKGVGSDYDWSFFKNKIIEGKAFKINDSVKTNDVLISKNLASKLKLKVGDPLKMYFVTGETQPRGRRFKISGIYETGLEDFDNMYVIADIAQIQKLNNWTKNQVAGFEVLIDNFKDLDKISENVYNIIGYNLNSVSIKQKYPQIFDWLKLQDMNVVIILVLMTIVAVITMISTLLILILERTNMIGILKALGTKNWSIRKIFIYNSIYIVSKGLLLGNIIALFLCELQLKFSIFKLPQESYYVSVVPINLNLTYILMINAGSFIICFLMLIFPSYIITKISPLKAIRFG